ncbi:hypothetical protein SAY87_009306 [Trapa incisa]|uniref:Condensin-2 complex subunit H2 n=1 Tax=Trapa incisa TaxID=236973 RepID=A0AAN7JZF2_9MYRT|nr:hypothetical protein SAY87_009306 [Trapa incisa]
MSGFGDEPGSTGGFHLVHAERDPESNWSVDLNRLLEEYLAKICAGEIPSEEDDRRIRVNFAEAALLLQGSVQVYSRKVEYLYSLVLHALEFISQQRQQEEQVEGVSNQPEESRSHQPQNEDDDPFWVSDDVPVDAKNSLDSSVEKDVPSDYFVRPPANLIVMEGDCLDASGDSGELESYLLATHDIFEDFILLDSSDAVEVNNFLKSSKVQNGDHSIQKTFLSPRSRSGAGGLRSSAGKSHRINISQTLDTGSNIQMNNFDIGSDPIACDEFPNEYGLNMDNGFCDPGEDSDDSDSYDPWKPLNPHEPGNLKVKPFKKVKCSRKLVTRPLRVASTLSQFPLGRFEGPISPEFISIWEKQQAACQKQHGTTSPPPYEKLRQSLVNGGCDHPSAFGNDDDTNGDFGDDGDFPDGDFPDFVSIDGEMPGKTMDEHIDLNEKHGLGSSPLYTEGAGGNEDPMSQTSLEDLCRSHLDALLASIAETEKQTELAARVSTWKQKIEQNLETQDSHPPFDIHVYGERIITKLSLEADQGVAMSFADIVHGGEKHDVARSFCALLQLVNNRDVELEKDKGGGSSVCFTATNPFYVRLSNNTRAGESQVQSAKKSVTSSMRRVKRTKTHKLMIVEPVANPRSKTRPRESPTQPKITPKFGKGGGILCTPEGKKRRKSRLVEPINLHSAG